MRDTTEFDRGTLNTIYTIHTDKGSHFRQPTRFSNSNPTTHNEQCEYTPRELDEHKIMGYI